MIAPNIPKSEMQQTLIRVTADLPPDRLAQVVDFALFVKALADREHQPSRTPDQLQALTRLFAGPKHTGLYDALMREREEERARDARTPDSKESATR
jgi:hypothetical protein